MPNDDPLERLGRQQIGRRMPGQLRPQVVKAHSQAVCTHGLGEGRARRPAEAVDERPLHQRDAERPQQRRVVRICGPGLLGPVDGLPQVEDRVGRAGFLGVAAGRLDYVEHLGDILGHRRVGHFGKPFGRQALGGDPVRLPAVHLDPRLQKEMRQRGHGDDAVAEGHAVAHVEDMEIEVEQADGHLSFPRFLCKDNL